MNPIKDYAKFVATLPYTSEIFGVYQPLIGWKSRRKLEWIARGTRAGLTPLIEEISAILQLSTASPADIEWKDLLKPDTLKEILNNKVFPRFRERSSEQTHQIFATTHQEPGETEEVFHARQKRLVAEAQ